MDPNGPDSSETLITVEQVRRPILVRVTPKCYRGFRQGRDCIWLENQKKQGRTFVMSLIVQTEFRQPKINKGFQIKVSL